MLDFKVKKKWIYDKSQEKKDTLKTLRDSSKLANLSDNALEVLYNRGFKTIKDIEKLLYSSMDDIHDTRLLKDSDKAVKIICHAIKNNWTIVNYSDYDSDGICSSAVCVSGIKNLGGSIHYYTNNRFIDGYGMCPAGVDEIVKRYPDVKLIITTDNGIVAYEGIKRAKELGIMVVVTDHHEMGDYLPDADAVVNPKRKDCKYPFKGLCGAGVIFKLMLLLYWEMGEDLDYIYDMIDIVAVASIGDVVPILDENRIIVREGLKKVKEEKRYVFKALREKTGVTDISTETFGFIYVPMLNALGRIEGSPDDAIAMFCSNDEDFINKSVDRLIEINDARKKLTEEQQLLGEEILEKKGLREVIVLYDPVFHEGIVGLIAGRLKEKYFRPVIVLSNHNGILKGSARSIPGFHMKESFDKIRHTIAGYGGHAMAAGLGVQEDKLQEFEDAICELAKETLKPEDYVPKINIDTVLNANDVSIKIVDELEILEPFGEGFRKPTYGLSNFYGSKKYYMGEEKQHVKIWSSTISVLMWSQAEKYKELGEPLNIKALGYPSINVYKNNVSLQFIVKDEEYVKA